jgi:hypothetical protein
LQLMTEILWNIMKYYEILWNIMKYYEIICRFMIHGDVYVCIYSITSTICAYTYANFLWPKFSQKQSQTYFCTFKCPWQGKAHDVARTHHQVHTTFGPDLRASADGVNAVAPT